MRHLALLAVLTVCSVSAHAETGGRLSGKVTDEAGRVIPGVAVSVTGSGAVGHYVGTTNRHGIYTVLGLPLREPLVVRADAPGKVSVVYRGVMARKGSGTVRDFRLRPPGVHEILVVMKPDRDIYRAAQAGLEETISGDVKVIELTGGRLHDVRAVRSALDDSPNAVIAIGREAARIARQYIRDVPVVHVMVADPRGTDLVATNICGVALNGGFGDTLDRLAALEPSASRLITIYDPRRLAHAVQDLRRAAADRGMTLDTATVRDRSEFLSAVRRIDPGGVDALFLLMDPDLLDRPTLDQVGRVIEMKKLVYVVPDPGLPELGGTFVLAPGFRAMGAEAGRLANVIVADGLTPDQIGVVFPAGRGFEENPQRARELGLAAPPVER